MILSLLIILLTKLLGSLLKVLPAWSFRPDQNNYFLAVLRYLYSLDGVFPMSDGVVPILGLFILVFTIFGVRRIVLIILNLLRGAGAQ
jgi:hypothetical protein